jgi:DNA repair protein RecN (Recombination protein N)
LRASAARALEAAVEAELGALAMPAARFVVGFVPVDPVGPDGAERCEFLLAANPGEPPRPLAKSASGGELSRVLLALVVAIADRRERRTLVFDEIDAGIGGATANAVGARLGRLARTSQVLCVTHLAQIAAWADAHRSLRKRERDGVTLVDVVELDAGARLEELARMLSGTTHGVSLEHAGEKLRDIDSRKNALEPAT